MKRESSTDEDEGGTKSATEEFETKKSAAIKSEYEKKKGLAFEDVKPVVTPAEAAQVKLEKSEDRGNERKRFKEEVIGLVEHFLFSALSQI